MSKNYMNDSQASEIVKFISDTMKFPIMGAGGGFAPIGTVSAYDGTVAPQGWLLCDGTVYNIADYPDLAAHYASHHEASNFYGGDGVTTFAVPDLRGEFIRGAGTNSHTNQGDGASLGVHQDASEVNLVSSNSGKTAIAAPYPSNGASPALGLNEDYKITRSGYVSVSATNTSSVTSDTARYTTRPTNTSLNFIVKATVSGDANAHHYSTEEQIVGKWIDGSDIYERTIVVENKITLHTLNAWNVVLSHSSYSFLNSVNLLIDVRTIGDITHEQKTNFNPYSFSYRNNNIEVYQNGATDALQAGSFIVLQYTKTSS